MQITRTHLAIPVRLFHGDEEVACFESLSLPKDLNEFLIGGVFKALKERGKTTDVFFSENLFEYGYCKNLEGELAVLIGPARTLPVDEPTARTLAERSPAQKEQYIDVIKYVNSLGLMQIKRFLHIMIVIHEALNGTKLDIDEFFVNDLPYEHNEKAFRDLSEHLRKAVYEFESKMDVYDAEQRILFYISNGMTDELKKFWADADPDPYAVNDLETLRIVKNYCIVAAAVITRGALASDMNPEDIYFLRDEYVMQIEMCKTVLEVFKMRYSMLIDISERVRKLKCGDSDHPLVGRVASYVQKNVEKRITLDDLAEEMKTNRAYLCRKFREETGMHLTEYIHRQKITEAKRLLRFSDASLIDIAHHLSFSSQSHFQKVFKEVEGMTPLEYRNKKLLE